ncbi:bifunctional transcriptional activator/DNA repair enzyme Ada [Abditibacteriota bacterium]|nr:bifunctional transcriptional activator/DNA repair enzyme Ada [Abditibacteriota bacterium]
MTNEEKWLAVLGRDARFGDAFVYGVSSTRIFCRPTCPSKRPQVENVTFFEGAGAAKEAGFRACKRCRPDKALPLDIEAVSGVSGRELRETQRMETLKQELQKDNGVLNAGLEAGFGSTRALYERAPSRLGMTPATYAKGGAGTTIRFAVQECELGFVLVARTPVGVCSIALGDRTDELEAGLRAEFFAAQIERDDAALKDELRAILDSLEGKTAFPDLPLDIRATAFQARVWKELQRIERGETISYSQLAERMGEPKAVRAVASACARNPVALVHPCHRVVGKDGAARGFRWSIERKRRLLEREVQR